MASKFCKQFLILLLLLLLILTINYVNGNIQTMQLRAEDGETDVITTNVRDLSKVSKIMKKGKTVKYICASDTSRASTWVAFHEINYNEDNERAEPIFDLVSYWCRENYMLASDFIKSVRHIGNAETYKSALSLYTNIYYNGKELYFDGNLLKLPEHINIKSYGFTGVDSWEIHPSNSQNTSAKCLQRDMKMNALSRSYQIPFKESTKDMQVSSIYRGCPSVPRHPRLHPQDPPLKNDTRYSRPTLPELRLYTGKDEQGAEFYMDGFELRLPRTFNFSSFHVNGDWQLFSGRDFDGDSFCLTNHETLNFVERNDTIEVGSIKHGCRHILFDESSGAATINLNLIAGGKEFTFLLSILLCNCLAYLLN